MTHFDLINMTKVTLGHLVNNIIHKDDFENGTIPNELIVKGAIDLAKETCKQLNKEKEQLESTGE